MGKLIHIKEYSTYRLLKESVKPEFDPDFKENLRKHIIDIIDLEEVLEPGEKEPEGEDRIKYLTKIIADEKGHDFGRVGRKRAIEDYLRGVPGTISLPFYNSQIPNFLYSLGVNNARELDGDQLDRIMFGKLAEIINEYF